MLVHLGPRILRLGGNVSEACFPSVSLVAGCGTATFLARCILNPALEKAHCVQVPRIDNVIDQIWEDRAYEVLALRAEKGELCDM